MRSSAGGCDCARAAHIGSMVRANTARVVATLHIAFTRRSPRLNQRGRLFPRLSVGAYVQKPFALDDILGAIHDLLRGNGHD